MATASTGTSTVTAATGEDAEFAAAAAEMDAADKAQQDAANTAEWGEEMVPVPVDEGILNQLAEMGFSDVRGRKAIVHGTSLEGAMNWLTEHQVNTLKNKKGLSCFVLLCFVLFSFATIDIKIIIVTHV